MSDRTVKVNLSANVSGYLRGMREAADETYKVDGAVDKLQQRRDAMRTLGVAALGIGTAMTGMAVMAAKAAVDWESAWAGVTKTVEGTPEQLAAVEEGLRGLARELPASHEEIAGVAEAAGQLGIQTDSVVGFTKTMVDLGETTNLSADQAATALARFMNVMGTSQDDVDRLGSAVVGLGNNYATTEAEIVEMSQRLAGAGAQVGLSEGEVLGLATALSSVGIEAEAGGSAMSKVMKDIASSVDEGGERVEQFAQISGLSADEFSRKWRDDPAAAMSAFVQGLANAEDQGNTTLGVLSDLGITEVRMSDALLRAAGASDIFSDAMAQGNAEFEENNALTDEAQKRYETVASQIEIAKNSIVDAGISLGSVFLPAIAGAADGIADFAGWFADLPDWMQDTVGVLTLVSGGLIGISGAVVTVMPKLYAFKAGMEALTKKPFSLSKATLALGGWGAALTGAITMVNLLVKAFGEGERQAEQFAQTFDSVTGEMTESTREMAVEMLSARDAFLWFQDDSTFEYAERLGISVDKVTDAALGNADAYGEVTDRLRELKAMTYDEKVAEAERLGISLQELEKATTRVSGEMNTTKGAIDAAADAADVEAEALDGVTGSSGDAADATGDAAGAMDEFEDQTTEARGALDDLAQAIRDYSTDAYGVQEAQDNLNKSINDSVGELEEFIKAGGDGQEAMHGTSNAGIELRDTFAGIDQTARDSATAVLENGGTVEDATEAYNTGRDRIVDMLTQMGIAPDKAQAWADKMYGPTGDVVGQLEDVAAASDRIPEEENIKVTADTAIAQWTIDEFIRANSSKSVQIATSWSGGITKADGGILENTPYGLVEAYANGGFRGPDIYRGGENIVKFAEQETGWEAYISGKPSERDRNVGVWQQAGERLGVTPAAPTQAAQPLIGSLTMQSSGDFTSDVDKVGWKLRTMQRGSRG